MRKHLVLYLLLVLIGVAVGLLVKPGDSFESANVPLQATDAVEEHGPNDGHDHGSSEAADWCAEHRVPESRCTLCNPQLIAEFKATNDWCAGHDLPESHCRLCNPEISFPQELFYIPASPEPIRASVFFPANAQGCATDQSIIQFASAETATRAGLTVEPALVTSELTPLEAPAEIRFDETRISLLTSSIPVTVIRWLAEPGQKIKEGEALAILESPAMANLQAEYIKAQAENLVRQQEFNRLTSMHDRDLISAADLESAEGQSRVAQAHLAGAEGLLRAAGFADIDMDELAKKQKVSPRYLLRAPRTGLLVERRASLGEQLQEGTSLAIVGDPGALWIEAQVREMDLREIHEGQPVEFSADGLALDRVGGSVIWVAQYLDPHTRSATVRAKITSAPGTLRANLFGRARFHAGASNGVVVIPKDAVQWEGCCNVVFVQEAPDRYRPRKVAIERGDNGHYRVTSGLEAGEPIVVKGSYLLKTELKKSSIGAGCCGLEAKS